MTQPNQETQPLSEDLLHVAIDAGWAVYVWDAGSLEADNGGTVILPKVQPAPAGLTDAARDVLVERQRQVSIEGWTPEHDDEHSLGELTIAAACLAVAGTDTQVFGDGEALDVWGLVAKHARDRHRQLVIAGALILAEIERLDRAALTQEGSGEA